MISDMSKFPKYPEFNMDLSLDCHLFGLAFHSSLILINLGDLSKHTGTAAKTNRNVPKITIYAASLHVYRMWTAVRCF